MTFSFPSKTAIFVLLAGMLMYPRPAAGQQDNTINPPTLPGSLPLPGQSKSGPSDDLRASIRARQERMREENAEKQLKKNTDQLFLLARQLKVSVDKTNAQVLSVEVIEKTKEIEKLAKKIREAEQNGH